MTFRERKQQVDGMLAMLPPDCIVHSIYVDKAGADVYMEGARGWKKMCEIMGDGGTYCCTPYENPPVYVHTYCLHNYLAEYETPQ